MVRYTLYAAFVFCFMLFPVNAYAGDMEVCEEDVENSVCKPRIMDAIERGDYRLIKRIVESGFDVNTHFTYYYGITPLMYAVQKGERQIAFYLLEQGADPSDNVPLDPVKTAQDHIDDYKRLIEEMHRRTTP